MILNTFKGAKSGSSLASAVWDHLHKTSLHPPPAGTSPTPVSTNPITIFICDTTKFDWIATSSPPPKTKPDGAEITG